MKSSIAFADPTNDIVVCDGNVIVDRKPDDEFGCSALVDSSTRIISQDLFDRSSSISILMDTGLVTDSLSQRLKLLESIDKSVESSQGFAAPIGLSLYIDSSLSKSLDSAIVRSFGTFPSIIVAVKYDNPGKTFRTVSSIVSYLNQSMPAFVKCFGESTKITIRIIADKTSKQIKQIVKNAQASKTCGRLVEIEVVEADISVEEDAGKTKKEAVDYFNWKKTERYLWNHSRSNQKKIGRAHV